MKKFLSMVLCLVMVLTIFTATAAQVMAVGNATELLTVTSGEFANDTITFTINLAPGSTKVNGVIIEAHYDSEALMVEKAGAAGSVDEYGDFVESVSGMYETGNKYDEDGVYAIAFMNATGVNITGERAFATITFRAISDVRDLETVTFKCVEFTTDDGNAENDIKKSNGAQTFSTKSFYTLTMPVVTEVNSMGDGLRVVWTDTQGADSYKLYRREENVSSWTLINDALTTNEFVDNTITKGKVYYYTVSATNAYGSTEMDATGLAGMNFGNIESINAVPTETGAYITWSALNGAEKYEVYRKLATSSSWQLLKTVTTCNYTDNSMVSGVDYNYKVRAIKGQYAADMSCDVATVKYIAVPFATVSNTNDGIEIYFESVNAEKYVIEKKIGDGAYATLIEIADNGDEEYVFIDEDVTADVKYSYTIKAVSGELSCKTTEIGSLTRLGAPVITESKNTVEGISLKWKTVGGATKYEIFRKSANETVAKSYATTTSTSYVDTNVVSGTKYVYEICAKNTTGNGANSNPQAIVTFVSAPKVSSVAAVESGIQIKWSSVIGAQTYKVYRAKANTSDWSVIGTISATNFIDETAEYGVYYKYTVSAVANGNESAYDTTGVEGMYFGNVKWINAEPTETGAVITWEALDKADSYEVYRRKIIETNWTKLAKVTSAKYTDTKMDSGVVYEYMVKAFNGKNVSDMICEPTSAKIIAIPTAIAKNVADGIQITITPVGGAEGYVIEKKINGVYKELTKLSKSTTTYVDTSVVAESEYSYRVYAVSSDINSGIYEIPAILRLSCPKITSATNTIPGISITWTPIDDASAYQVLRKKSGDKTWKVIANAVTGTSFIDADVDSGKVYTYTINAILKDGGQSGYDGTGVSYKFLETPDLVSVENVSGGIQFKWSSVYGATSYKVYRKTSNTDWVLIAKDVTTTSYVDKTAAVATKYTYTVKAADGAYESSFDSGLNITSVSKPATPKLTKVANTSTGPQITWGAVAGADTYIVYRKTYNAKTKKWGGWEVANKSVKTASYVDKTAKTGTYYIYTVKAVNAAGSSGYDKTGLKTYFMSMPKVSSVANATNGVTVKWSKITGATGYIVYRKTYNAKTKKWGGWTNLGKTTGASFTDKTAKSGTYYLYTVKAYYGSYYSAYNTSGTKIYFMSAPKLSSATSAKAGITTKWGKVTGATGYIVYRKTGSGGWTKIATIKKNSTVSYLDKTAKKGVTYKYTVRAYYGSYNSAYNTSGLTCKDKY